MEADSAAPASDNPQKEFKLESDDRSTVKDQPMTCVSKEQNNAFLTYEENANSNKLTANSTRSGKSKVDIKVD